MWNQERRKPDSAVRLLRGHRFDTSETYSRNPVHDTWISETDLAETGSWMKNMGMPTAIVPFAGFVEFFGGLGLLLGILTPIIALLSALWMLSTTWFAITKLKKKYMGGYELDITLLLAALALTFLGGGAFSIDRLIGL